MNAVAGIAATGAGARLRAAREARGLDIQQVASELRLPARHIESLEAEDAGKLPGPSFTCAYLRKYSALLQLPSDAIVETFPGMPEYLAGVRSTMMNTKLVAGQEEPEIRETNSQPRAVASESMSSSTRPAAHSAVDRSSVILVAVAAVIAIWLISKFVGNDEVASVEPVATESMHVEPEKPVESGPAAPAEQVVVDPAATEPVVVPTPAAAESRPALPPLPPMAEITFRFRDDSWLEVYDATGTRLAFELGRGGQSRTLRGPAPLRVLLGVAGNVDIRYNEQDFDMSPYRDREFIEMHIGRAEDNRVPSN